jgi:hypothetical protein
MFLTKAEVRRLSGTCQKQSFPCRGELTLSPSAGNQGRPLRCLSVDLPRFSGAAA